MSSRARRRDEATRSPSPAALAGSPFERFGMTRPRIALASENKYAFMPTPRDLALGFRYIQVGGLIRSQAYAVFDVDRADAKAAWREALLPPPTFIVENPENGHAHYFWELSIPVSMLPIGKATRYLSAIMDGYRNRLQADWRYVGLAAMNPLCTRAWQVSAANVRYDLPTLAASLRPVDYVRPVRSQGLGRNCDLFDWTRTGFAYPSVREFAEQAAFAAAVAAYALDLNRRAFEDPLSDKEVGWVAKSIAKYTWKHRERYTRAVKRPRRGRMGFEPLPRIMDANEKLREIRERQAAAGPASRAAVREATRARIMAAVLALVEQEKRVSAAAVSRYTGLGYATIKRHRDLLAGDGKVVVLPRRRAKVAHTVYSGVQRPGGPAAPVPEESTRESGKTPCAPR